MQKYSASLKICELLLPNRHHRVQLFLGVFSYLIQMHLIQSVFPWIVYNNFTKWLALHTIILHLGSSV